MGYFGRTTMTTTKSKEVLRIESWLKTVGIEASKSQDLIDKYGIENTYKLVQEALMRPHDMAKHLDGTRRSSKGTILHLLENDLSPEQISATTRVDIEKVKSSMPQEVAIENVENTETTPETVDNNTLETNTPEETREETRAALIDQVEASMAPDAEKRNLIAETEASAFDNRLKQRTSTAETETTTPITEAETTTSQIPYEEQIEKNRQTWLQNKLKSELDTQTTPTDLTLVQQKEALLQQYVDLRKKRYEALCYNSGLDMYNASLAITSNCKNKKAMNKHIWNGCKNIDESIVPADSTARMVPHIITSDRTRNSLCNFNDKKGVASCAITGATIVYDVCQKMQFMNGANFTPPSVEGNQYRGANGHFTYDIQTKGYTGSGKMSDLISSGKVGPGDRVSTKSEGTESGYHLRTVIAVNRNEQGEVTGYILQGNNNLELSYHKIPDPKDSLNNRIVKYSSTSQWAYDQIEKEYGYMKDCSIEEIQFAIKREKEAITSTIIDTVQEKETRLAELDSTKANQYYANEYPFLYRDNAPILLSHSIAPEMLKAELIAMNGEEVISPNIYFQQRDFDKRLVARLEARARKKSNSTTRDINTVFPAIINQGAELS